MAQSISLISGSPLIGSPIVMQLTPESYAANRTFHRVVVRVYAALETDDDFTTFDFSTPVETKQVNGDYVTVSSNFDISTALQAVADKYEYEATPPTRYPYIKFRVEAWDEWMVEGNISTEQGVVAWPAQPVGDNKFYAYAFIGAWTDMERMKANVDIHGSVEYLDTSVMSRKPNSSPEVVFLGVPFIYPAEFNRSILDTDLMSDDADPQFVSGAPTNGPKSVAYTPQAEGAVTVDSHSLYVVDEPNNAYVLRFINGMGCMESLHVTSLVKRETSNKTEKHSVARQETLKKFSRTVTVKQDGPETWTLTSGPLDREWASWYVHEFLMAEQIWLSVPAGSPGEVIWIPCHVLPEETITLEDQTKAQPYEVQFRLEMDINGSPL